jgi:uncharacterized damage-inducible protein DinB
MSSTRRNPQDLLLRMRDFCSFLEMLVDVRADVLLSPMAEGKWSVQEAIAHIMAYDESFLQSAVIPIESGGQPQLADEADNQSFNRAAAALGRKLTKAQLLERAASARRRLVDHLQSLPAEAFWTKLDGGADVDLAELVDRDFVSHDRSHMEQMRKYLESRGHPGIAC